MQDLWVKVVDIAKLVSIAAGFGAGVIAVYITARLAPIVRKLDVLKNLFEALSKDRKQEDARLGVRIEEQNQRIEKIKSNLPNCEAKQAEISAAIAAFKAQIRLDVVENLAKVSEANAQFRTSVKEQLMAQTTEWSREGITRQAVEKICKDLREDIRRELKREIEQLEKRLDEKR